MQETQSQPAPPPISELDATALSAGQLGDPSPMWEQKSALLIGFSTGMLIALIFLAYIVLSAAKALP